VNTPAAADSSTALALERTRLAHERTLMAWVRTATSLISFGFTIYKAFEYLRQRQPDVAHGVLGPRNFALVRCAPMIASSGTMAGRRRSAW
jgi:inner membrane protein YidH